jgi:hypothetical protein
MKANGHNPGGAPEPGWPVLDRAAAHHGLVGIFVKGIEEDTEADPAALLIQFLVAFGSIAGRNCHFYADGFRHHANLSVAVIGHTSIGRKGTALRRVLEPFRLLSDSWPTTRIKSGLSSGEGLIHAVRDPVTKITQDKKTGEITEETVDQGEPDKRLLITEEEFSRVLRVMARPENILSTILRTAWDGANLAVMTRASALQATTPHISVIAHSTVADLTKYLDATEAANGYANRFLFWLSKRARELPHGREIAPRIVEEISSGLRQAVDWAYGDGPFGGDRRIEMDGEARALWETVYAGLTADRPGLLGQITARGAPYVRRLALIYTMLDRAKATGRPHLAAALAVWRYAEGSAAYIWGDATGDHTADEIWRLLRGAGTGGMKQTDILQAVGRHTSGVVLSRAFSVLSGYGIVESMTKPSGIAGGRPATYWRVKLGAGV